MILYFTWGSLHQTAKTEDCGEVKLVNQPAHNIPRGANYLIAYFTGPFATLFVEFSQSKHFTCN
jgi:hypothetical protein